MPEVQTRGKTMKFPYTKPGIAKAKAVAKEEKGELKVDKEKGEKIKKKPMLSDDGVVMT